MRRIVPLLLLGIASALFLGACSSVSAGAWLVHYTDAEESVPPYLYLVVESFEANEEGSHEIYEVCETVTFIPTGKTDPHGEAIYERADGTVENPFVGEFDCDDFEDHDKPVLVVSSIPTEFREIAGYADYPTLPGK